jgi:hypothetical protein
MRIVAGGTAGSADAAVLPRGSQWQFRGPVDRKPNGFLLWRRGTGL